MALDELLDEHEQGERVRAWLRENALALVAGIGLGLAAIFGWKWWQQEQLDQRAALGARYDAAVATIESGELETAEAEVAALEGVPYATLGALRLARAQVDANQPAEAIATLEAASAEDPALQRVVQLRLARLLLDAGRAEDAIARLGDADAPAMLELRGDAEVALGRVEAARATYLQAVEAVEQDGPQRRLLEIKLVSVGGTPPDDDASA